MKCKNCGSKDLVTRMVVSTFATIDLENLCVDEVDEPDTADFDLKEVETASCLDCNTEYWVDSYVEGSEIKLKLKEEIVR